MRIVFIVGSLAGGGAERVVSELAAQMSNQGDNVSIILVAQNKVTYHIPENVSIIDCATIQAKRGMSFFKRIKKIRREIEIINPDVCISFTVGVNIYSIISCMFSEYKLVIAERNDPRYDPTDRFTRCLRKLLYPFADKYVFQTNGEKEFFSKAIQKKSIVIPNPVDPDMPKPYNGVRRKTFVSAVRLFPQKNIKMSIDAFKIVYALYPDYRFEIYGDGPLRSELQCYIDSVGLGNVITLKGSTNTLYEDIKDAFAFLLSSNYEGISNSMLESMALGLPTISTDYPSGGARETIENGKNGFVVPVGGTNEMAEKMIALIENKELYDRLSNNAPKVRETYKSGVITEKWIAYICQK